MTWGPPSLDEFKEIVEANRVEGWPDRVDYQKLYKASAGMPGIVVALLTLGVKPEDLEEAAGEEYPLPADKALELARKGERGELARHVAAMRRRVEGLVDSIVSGDLLLAALIAVYPLPLTDVEVNAVKRCVDYWNKARTAGLLGEEPPQPPPYCPLQAPGEELRAEGRLLERVTTKETQKHATLAGRVEEVRVYWPRPQLRALADYVYSSKRGRAWSHVTLASKVLLKTASTIIDKNDKIDLLTIELGSSSVVNLLVAGDVRGVEEDLIVSASWSVKSTLYPLLITLYKEREDMLIDLLVKSLRENPNPTLVGSIRKSITLFSTMHKSKILEALLSVAVKCLEKGCSDKLIEQLVLSLCGAHVNIAAVVPIGEKEWRAFFHDYTKTL